MGPMQTGRLDLADYDPSYARPPARQGRGTPQIEPVPAERLRRREREEAEDDWQHDRGRGFVLDWKIVFLVDLAMIVLPVPVVVAAPR